MVIYMIWCEATEKVYVGQCTGSLAKRIQLHRKLARSDVGRLGAEIVELGWSAFEVFVLERCSTLAQLNEREAWWIDHMHATETSIGYNVRKGGCNKQLSDEARERCRAAGRAQGDRMRGKRQPQLPRTPEQASRLERKRLWAAADACGRRELLRSWGRKGALASAKGVVKPAG